MLSKIGLKYQRHFQQVGEKVRVKTQHKKHKAKIRGQRDTFDATNQIKRQKVLLIDIVILKSIFLYAYIYKIILKFLQKLLIINSYINNIIAMSFLDKFKGKTHMITKQDIGGILGKANSHFNVHLLNKIRLKIRKEIKTLLQ